MNMAARIVPASPAPVDPLTFFDGLVEATGFFALRNGRVKRRFTARFAGQAAGEAISIAESLVYDDGEAASRTWRLERCGPGSWRGTATDAAGAIAIERISDCETRWRYAMDIPVGKRCIRFAFVDCMVETGPGQWVSTTTMSKFGFEIGRLICEYRRIMR